MFFGAPSNPHTRKPLDSQATPPQPIAGGMSPEAWLHSPPVVMPWGLPVGVQPPIFGHGQPVPALKMPPVSTAGTYGSNISTFTSPCKRKIDPDLDFKTPPNKLQITEERMIAHMQGLHIAEPPADPTPQSSESTSPRLILSEELKSIQNETNILPTHILLQRLQPKPSMALMVWQPPSSTFPFKTREEAEESELANNNNNNNNNNNGSTSNNNNKEDLNQDMMETT